MSINIGDMLDERFEVLEVHSGGMGVVYVLRDLDRGDRVAAKTIREDFRDDARVVRRFDREVRTWIHLGEHENLVSALSVRRIGDLPFLFLEYVDGPTLAALLAEDGPLPVAEALDLGLQFARGLRHAHEAPMREGASGLVHRDVKPENLFITRRRIGKVSDLGIVKVLSADLAATQEGIGLGTPLYVSPEQLKGAADVDGRSDVYSFGAVLYEMLTGRPPLKADTLESQIYLILRTRPEPPSSRNPAVPAELDELVLRCLEKDPVDRFTGFRALTEALRRVMAAVSARPSEDLRRTCTSCGYSSARDRPSCPVCDSAMGEPHAPVLARPEETARPARVAIEAAEFLHPAARIGDRVTVRVAVVNPAGAAARHGSLPLVLPDPDTFRREGPTEVWRGDVPPTPSGRPFEILYEIVPLREGTYALPASELSYEDEQGLHQVAAAPTGARLRVSFNYELPLAGREGILNEVRELLAPHRAAFCLMTGEPGMGRSRILGELGRELTDSGWSVLRGKALERGREPMKLFLDLARQVFDIGREPLPAKSLVARVIDRLGPLVGESPAVSGYFAAFLRGGGFTEAQVRMRESFWFQLLAGLARATPTVLLLDNLHWADPESVDLLESLILRATDEGVPLAIVGASLPRDPHEATQRRIDHLREHYSALAARYERTRHVELLPLLPADVVPLLDTVFPGNTLAEDHPWLPQALSPRQTGGNPFHLVRLLRLLREARDEEGEPLVSAEGGSWTLRSELSEESLGQWIPEGAEDTVRTLLAPLDPVDRETLETAALIGEEFDLDILEALAESRTGLYRSLEALERTDLIRAAEGRRFRFASSLVPRVVERLVRDRSTLEFARRHREVASAFEVARGARGLRRAALAYSRHLHLSGERDAAFSWMVTAAEELVRRQVFRRADTVLDAAGELLEGGAEADEATLGTFWFLRAEVARLAGRLSGALEAFERAIELLTAPESRAVLALAFSKMGKVHEARGETDRALHCYQLGAQVREDLGDTGGMAHSLNNLGSLHALSGREEAALEAFRRARDLAKESGNVLALGDALNRLATLRERRGDLERAEDLFRESLALGESTGDRLGLARSLNGLGTVAARRGRLRDAQEFFRQVLEVRREVGDREGAANVLSNLGVMADRLGEWERSLDYYRRSIQAHREIGSRRGLASVLNNLGVVNLTRGDVSRAIERFSESLRIREEIGDRERLGIALQNLGEAWSLAGRPDRTEEYYVRARDAFEAAGDEIGLAGLRVARAALLRRQGELTRAGEEIRAALESEGREPAQRAELHLEMAEILVARGDVAAAAATVRHAHELAIESGNRVVRAQSRRLLAIVLEHDGDSAEARRQLQEAASELPATNGPELLRVLLVRAEIEFSEGSEDLTATLRRAGEVHDSLLARGAVLPEREKLGSLSGRASRKRSNKNGDSS